MAKLNDSSPRFYIAKIYAVFFTPNSIHLKCSWPKAYHY